MSFVGFGLYLGDQLGDTLSHNYLWQKVPAWKGLEEHALSLPKRRWILIRHVGACMSFLGSVDPDSFKSFT